jgi:hypothetical protein
MRATVGRFASLDRALRPDLAGALRAPLVQAEDHELHIGQAGGALELLLDLLLVRGPDGAGESGQVGCRPEVP